MNNRYSVGQSLFVPWEELDKKIRFWCDDYYGYKTESFAERDGTSAYVTSVLRAESYDKFSELLKTYDRENDYDAKDEFCPEGNSMLPELPSLRFIGEIFQSDFGFLPKSMIAIEYGVLFFEKPVGYGCCSDYAERNTLVRYLYRDGSNSKFPQSAVVKGTITNTQISDIFSCLDSDGCFIPAQVGLPCTYAEPYSPNDDDHEFCELEGGDTFTETASAADVEMTVEELVEKFKAAKGKWGVYNV